jgi:hypothetical protein
MEALLLSIIIEEGGANGTFVMVVEKGTLPDKAICDESWQR